MYIAPGYTTAEWKKLKLDDPASKDWDTAVDIVDARITGRYLDPADTLIATDAKVRSLVKRRFGFTILAIDCLLIETLQAFIDGHTNTRNGSKESFRRFLTSRPRFAKYFTVTHAERFFTDFRCGIFHQAEVQGNSIVWSVGDLLTMSGNSMTINRTKFHDTLKKEFRDYLAVLRDQANTKPRAKFRKKMDHICRD